VISIALVTSAAGKQY